MKTLLSICPDINDWPKRWMNDDKDLVYGSELLEIMKAFMINLIAKDLRDKTIKKHLDNLWLLGGEIVRSVHTYDEYHISPIIKLKSSIGPDGGPYCRHLNNENEMNSFDTTCRKFSRHLHRTKK